MNQLFDAKFVEDAMSSVFSCHLTRSGSDAPKRPQKITSAARLCIFPEKHRRACCGASRKYTDLVQERPGNVAPLHCTSHSSYVPAPLHGWTSDEQLSLIAAVKAVPSEHSLLIGHCGWTEEIAHYKYLQLISEQVPSKSTQECERCLRHLEVKRVAYFGQHRSHDHRG